MKKIYKLIKKYPFVNFVGVLVLLFGLIYLSNSLRKKTVETQEIAPNIPVVKTYQPGKNQLLTSAKIINDGIIEIAAQSGGVVQKINVNEGQKVYKGQQLLSLSSNYQGANSQALQLDLTEKRWLSEHANFWDQHTGDNIRQDLSQVNTHHTITMSGSEYTTYNARQNQLISDLNFSMGDRNQQLSLDNAEMNLKLAQISASLMRPATPMAGVVEKIKVKNGQLINPGQVVAVVRSNQDKIKLELNISDKMLKYVDFDSQAYFEFQAQKYPASFAFLPSTPDQGSSYKLTLTPADAVEMVADLPHGTFVNLSLPLKNNAQSFLIPLNAVYQTQNSNYVFILAQNETGEMIAAQKNISLGPVIGDLVVVEGGLSTTDRLLLSLNLINNQRIQIQE